MRTFPLEEIARLTGGRVLTGAGEPVAGLSLDSRTAVPGCLFAALKGERTDGHDFCRQAAARGASALMVERPVEVPEGTGAVQVTSVERAVRALGAEARSRFSGEVVGIVGSCGKTTTKDFAAAVLALLGPTYATPGNRNNLLGVPESLMNADPDSRFWVLELGISKPGEMEELAPIARPTAVAFTTIQPVHTEFFPSLEAIRDEKAKVLRWTKEGGRVFLNADDPLLCALELPPAFEPLAYGTSDGARLRVETLGTAHPEGVPFTLSFEGRKAQGFLPLPGVHNLLNFAAACAVGISYGAPLRKMACAAESLTPARHRGERFHLTGDVFLLDESYNANPAAMEAVLRSLEAWGERRVLAALGEMLELGPAWLEHHKKVGQLAAEAGVNVLLAVGGEGAKAMADAFIGRGREVLYVPRWLDGAEWLEERIRNGDGIVVKGSRGVGLDGLVAWLRARRGY